MARWRIIIVVVLFCAAIASVTAMGVYATGARGRLSDDVQAQVRRAIVGYQLAGGSERPPGMVGKKLTVRDDVALQARFLRRLKRYATGPALAWGDTWDYAAALREDEWDTRELVGVTGAIVYWVAPRKSISGEVHVRAGVGQRYKVIRWDEKAGRAVPQRDWVPGVIVYDYTLRQVDGVWKVADSVHWRFYDPRTEQLCTGP